MSDRNHDLRDRVRTTRAAARALAALRPGDRTRGLDAMAAALRSHASDILAANADDVRRAEASGTAAAMIDRLALTPARIEGMASAIDTIARQPDPVGERLQETRRPNGLRVAKQRIPLGLILMIYEARPNVTSDAAALCLRSGNGVVLRGGRDACASNAAIGAVLRSALQAADLPADAILVLSDLAREDLQTLLEMDDLLDLAIPRGGPGLIRQVRAWSKVPTIQHYMGNCHVYLHEDAPVDRSVEIVRNAKVSRPSVCNALETLLVHQDAVERLLPALGRALALDGVRWHACPRAMPALTAAGADVIAAKDEDWETEYLSLDLAVRVVPSLEAAAEHIQTWGSGHTEAIVTDSLAATQAFLDAVDSSCVMINASTRFADGGELGLGAEIGISTSKLHAYGPMGATELTTTRFVVTGEGHIR